MICSNGHNKISLGEISGPSPGNILRDKVLMVRYQLPRGTEEVRRV